MSTTKIPITDEVLKRIAQAVYDKFIEMRPVGRKPKCFCGRCRACRVRAVYARRRAAREAAAS